MSYKAFVSSTFKELEKHREYVIDALRKAGFFVDPMEDWVANNDEPKVFSKARIEGCDICVLLVAFRRGFIPDGETMSITQMEYYTAISEGLYILAFILDENSPWPRKFDDLDKDPEIFKWRQYLQKKHGIGFFSLEPSSIQIAPALTRWLAERNNYNSVMYDYEHILSLQPDLLELKKECDTSDTNSTLKILREKIIIRLNNIASGNKIDCKGIPPADLLRLLAVNKLINSETHRSLEYAVGVTSEILYEKKVEKEEAIKAIQETAVGFNFINASNFNLPHFRLSVQHDGQWMFSFLIKDKVVIHSESFKSHESVLNGIRSARRIVEIGRIEKFQAKDGMHFFMLIGANGQIMGKSIFFDSIPEMESKVIFIKELLPMAPIIEIG